MSINDIIKKVNYLKSTFKNEAELNDKTGIIQLI